MSESEPAATRTAVLMDRQAVRARIKEMPSGKHSAVYLQFLLEKWAKMRGVHIGHQSHASLAFFVDGHRLGAKFCVELRGHGHAVGHAEFPFPPCSRKHRRQSFLAARTVFEALRARRAGCVPKRRAVVAQQAMFDGCEANEGAAS